MKLKEITFHLENCDYITIDGKYIGDFLVDEIKTSFSRAGCNVIMKMETANVFAIEIHRDANKSYNQLGCEEYNTTFFERLSISKDICAIDFALIEDHTEENGELLVEYHEYFVDWCGESDYENDAQVSYISNLGHLYIVIKENGEIEDYFNKEEINDREYINYKFDMYSIEDISPIKTCGDCSKYTGIGDWDLSCLEKHEDHPYGFLCYEDTPACEKFEDKENSNP